MQGKIRNYSPGAKQGSLLGEDGETYLFALDDVSTSKPFFEKTWPNAEVTFTPSDKGRATSIYLVKEKAPVAMGIMAAAAVALVIIGLLIYGAGRNENTNSGIVEDIKGEASTPTANKGYAIDKHQGYDSYIGFVENDDIDGPFGKFLSDNDGKIVYLDAVLPVGSAMEKDPQDDHRTFMLYSLKDCEEGMEKSRCGGAEYLVRSNQKAAAYFVFDPAVGSERLRGFWKFEIAQGMHQGFFSAGLTGVDVAAPQAEQATGGSCQGSDGDSYPCKLNQVISKEDWPQLRASLSFASTMPKDTVVKWANVATLHKGNLTVVEEKGAAQCGLYKVSRIEGKIEDAVTVEWCSR